MDTIHYCQQLSDRKRKKKLRVAGEVTALTVIFDKTLEYFD